LSLGVGVFTLPTVLNSVGWIVGIGLMLVFGTMSMLLQLMLLDVALARNVKYWDEMSTLVPMGKVMSNISQFLSLIIGNSAHIQVVAGMFSA
jgi:amino acid permease